MNDSKRKPTHREGIVRWGPREPFDAGKSRGTQWLLKMSHCMASFSVACGELGACRCQNCVGPRDKLHGTKSQNGVAQRHTCSSEGPLGRRFVKFFLVLRADLTAHIHATRFVHMSQLVWCSKSQVTTFGHVTISFRNQRDDGNSNCSRADGAHESRSISGWTPFPFFAPGATSGTWRQDAVVLGKKADTTPPRKGPRDLTKNVFVMSTTKLKRNSLPT